MFKGRWYRIAHGTGLPINGDIGVSFDNFMLLFSASVDYPGATINLISQDLPLDMKVQLRIQEVPTGWQVDMLHFTEEKELEEINPSIVSLSSGAWSVSDQSEAFEYNIICKFNDIYSDEDLFSWSELFTFDPKTKSIRANYTFYSVGGISAYGLGRPSDGSGAMISLYNKLDKTEPGSALDACVGPLITDMIANHRQPASSIVQSPEMRFVTDEQIQRWDNGTGTGGTDAYLATLKRYLKISPDEKFLYTTIDFYSEKGVSAMGVSGEAGEGSGSGGGAPLYYGLDKNERGYALDAYIGPEIVRLIDLRAPIEHGHEADEINESHLKKFVNAVQIASWTGAANASSLHIGNSDLHLTKELKDYLIALKQVLVAEGNVLYSKVDFYSEKGVSASGYSSGMVVNPPAPPQAPYAGLDRQAPGLPLDASVAPLLVSMINSMGGGGSSGPITADMVTETLTRKFVTPSQIQAWNKAITDLGELDTIVGTIYSSQNNLSGSIAALDAAIGTLQGGLNSANQNIGGLSASLSALDSSVNQHIQNTDGHLSADQMSYLNALMNKLKVTANSVYTTVDFFSQGGVTAMMQV